MALKVYLLFFLLTFMSANTLQEAIDRAKIGSILKLKAGVYRGNIVINKPLSIIGIEDGVVIDGKGSGTVIRVNSSYVTLKNLKIQGSGDRHDKLDAAISIKDSQHCEVSNVIIEDSLFGIDMSNVNNSIITNNKITSKDVELGFRGDGLRLWYSNKNIIKGNSLVRSRDMVVWYSHENIIENNSAQYCRYSLHFMYAGKNYIKNNSYKFNSVGIFFMYSKDSIVEGNVIQNSLGPTGMGIGLKDVSNFTIKNNTVIYNAQGFYIDRSSFEPDEYNLIENNNILYNAEGFHFHSVSQRNIIKGNNIQGNIEDIVNDSYSSQAKANDFKENYWDNYEGFDKNNDGIGDNPHRVYSYADQLWTYNPSVKFFYGSPVISMLNFLAKLAPFSKPVFLLEDASPKMSMRK